MSNGNQEYSTFLASFFMALSEAEKEIGPRAYFPLQLVMIVVLPTVLLWWQGVDFPVQQAQFTNVLAAFLVIVGVLASVSISSIVQIQNITSQYPFSDYLREEGLLNFFVFVPQFTFVIQVLCLAGLCAVLFAAIVFENLMFEFLVLSSLFLLYTLIKTLNLLSLIRKLSWHHAQYFIEYNKV